MFGATAMGVQNAHSRLVARAGVPNTVMTGNVTQVILDALDLCSPRVAADAKAAARTRVAALRRTPRLRHERVSPKCFRQS